MQSLYHNLPSFDGVGQHQGRRYESRDEIYDERARRLTLDLTAAYEEECGLVSYVRSGSLRGGVVTVTESIRLDSERLVDFVLVTHREPTLLDGARVALAEGCVLEYDERLSAEVEAFDPVGMNTVRAWGTEKLYRLHFTARTDSIECTFTVRAE
jgi:hypothetical protein